MSTFQNTITCLFCFVFLSGLASQTCSVSINFDSIDLCKGQQVMLEATGSGAGTFLWPIDSSTSKRLGWSVTTDTFLVVEFTATNGCTATDTVWINALGFDVEITSNPASDTIEQGETLILTAKTTPSSGNFTFEWTEDGSIMLNETSRTLEVVANTNQNQIKYTVAIEDEDGCTREPQRSFVVIKPDIVAPKAFTPNGDALNDEFRLVLTKGTIVVEKLQIYNRWGELIYEGAGDNAAWDGMFNGELQASDVYFYNAWVRKGKNAALSQERGDFTLLR